MSTKYQQEYLEQDENGNKLQFVTKNVAESSMKFMQKLCQHFINGFDCGA